MATTTTGKWENGIFKGDFSAWPHKPYILQNFKAKFLKYDSITGVNEIMIPQF